MVQQQEKQSMMNTMNLTFMKKELEDNAEIMSLSNLIDKIWTQEMFFS